MGRIHLCTAVAVVVAASLLPVYATAEKAPDDSEERDFVYSKGGGDSPPVSIGVRYLGSNRGYQLTVSHGVRDDVWYYPYILGWKDNECSILAGSNAFESTWHPTWAGLTDDGIRMTVVDTPQTRYYRPPGTYHEVQLKWSDRDDGHPVLQREKTTEWQRPARVETALEKNNFYDATRLGETREPTKVKRGFPRAEKQLQMPQFAPRIIRRAEKLAANDENRRASRLLSWFHTAVLYDYQKTTTTSFDDLKLNSVQSVYAVAPKDVRTPGGESVELPFSRSPQDVENVELESAVEAVDGFLEEGDLIQAAGEAVLAARAMRTHGTPKKRIEFFRQLLQIVHHRALATYEPNQPKTAYRSTKMLEWVLVEPAAVTGFGSLDEIETTRTANGLELPKTQSVAAVLNDYAFIAEQRPIFAQYSPLLVLRTVVEMAPDRAVAHLNLADKLMRRFGRGSFTEPERIIGLYRDYIRLREKSGKPVDDRVSDLAEPAGVKRLADEAWSRGVRKLSKKELLFPSHWFLFAVRAYQMYQEERGEAEEPLSKTVRKRLAVPDLALERAEKAWRASRPAFASRWLDIYTGFPPNPKKHWEEGSRSLPDKWKKRMNPGDYKCF